MLKGKNRSKGINKGSDRSQVERLVDIMFSDVAIPEASMGRMRAWLVDPDKVQEKEDALYGKFREVFKYNAEPVLAPQLWPELARRLGMDETPVMPAYDCLAPAESASAEEEEEASEEPEPETATEGDSEHESAAVRERRRLSFRRIAPRVAAVLVPALVVLGAVLWIVDRRPDALVEIAVPEGGAQTIELPDGSRIEAEGGTTIAYNEEGFEDRRFVTLSGVALFDVVDIMDKGVPVPFTVEAENLTVNVLGTVFRLAREENTPEGAAVSLYEGSVGVTIEPGAETETGGRKEIEAVLAAGERLRVNTLTGEHSTELIPASEMAGHGAMPILRFDEANLGDLVVALEMNYGVVFDVAEGIDRTRGRYTANFEDLSLDEVLDMLSKIDIDLSFGRSGDPERVTVRRK